MDPLSPLQYALGAASGAAVGFSLGLIGGGGSILSVPLVVYLVGVRNPHVAIGTSAVGVAANAVVSLLMHARNGSVEWRIATLFAAFGIVGAWGGSALGKATDGRRLLVLFAMLMFVFGIVMLKHRRRDAARPRLDDWSAPRLAALGLSTGAASGFFGIGGGFLIVPVLLHATRMPILLAVGSSLVAVASFGLITALSYALSGWVEWPLAAAMLAGGAAGGLAGTRLACRLGARQGVLNTIFACVVFVVAAYVLYRSGAGS